MKKTNGAYLSFTTLISGIRHLMVTSSRDEHQSIERRTGELQWRRWWPYIFSIFIKLREYGLRRFNSKWEGQFTEFDKAIEQWIWFKCELRRAKRLLLLLVLYIWLLLLKLRLRLVSPVWKDDVLMKRV